VFIREICGKNRKTPHLNYLNESHNSLGLQMNSELSRIQ
jgi:hypothetical protein